MIGDVVDKHRVAHQTAGQLEPRFSLLTKLLIHSSLSIFTHTEAPLLCLVFSPFLFTDIGLILLFWNEDFYVIHSSHFS